MLSDEQYEAVLQRAQRANPGFAACLELQRQLGLYAHEVMHSAHQLHLWRKILMSQPEHKPVVLMVGSPERRTPRHILPCSLERTLQVLGRARAAKQAQRAQLVPLAPHERSSEAYARLCASIGISATELEHDLRCLYARDQFLARLPGGQTDDLDQFLLVTGWVAGLLGENPAQDTWRVWWTYLHLHITPTPMALPVSLAFE